MKFLNTSLLLIAIVIGALLASPFEKAAAASTSGSNQSGDPGCDPQSRAAGLRCYRLTVSACSEPAVFGKGSLRLERGWSTGKLSIPWKIGFDRATTNRAAGF